MVAGVCVLWWWCMYVRSYHTHRSHTDTPHEYLQFAFACTDLRSAHVSTEEAAVSDETAFENLSTYGLRLNQREKDWISGLDVFKRNKVLTCSLAELQQKTGPSTSTFVKQGSLLSWPGGRLHAAPACTKERIVIFAQVCLSDNVPVYDNFASVDEITLLLEIASQSKDAELAKNLVKCGLVRYFSLKNSRLINEDYINLIQNRPLKRLFLKLQQIELDVQKVVDTSVLELMQNK